MKRTAVGESRFWGLLLNWAIGLGSFVLACLMIRQVLPFPEISQVAEKLRFFEEHKNEFDTILSEPVGFITRFVRQYSIRRCASMASPTKGFNFWAGFIGST